MPRLLPSLAAMAALTLAACQPGGFSSELPEGKPLGIVISPADVTLTMDAGKAAQQAYRAHGYYESRPPDGAAGVPAGGVDITEHVTWALANASMGRFVGATLRTEVGTGSAPRPAGQGGTTEVTATLGEVIGRARLKVVYRQSVRSPKVPADADKRFAGPVSAARAPRIVYPAGGVLLPPNLHQLELQWDKGAGNDLFLVTITSPLLQLKLYTTWNT